MTQWLIPDPQLPLPTAGVVVALVALAVAAAGVATVAVRHRHPAPVAPDEPTQRAPWQPALRTSSERRAAVATVVVHTVAYLAVVALTGSLWDHGIPFDRRLALPLLPPLAALVAAGADAAVNRPSRPRSRTGVALALVVPSLVLVAVNAQASREQIWSRPPSGVWTPPLRYPTMDTVAALPDEVLVFANQPSAVFALSSRPLLALPLVRSPMTGVPNPNAQRDLDQLVGLLAEGRAAVVFERATVWLHGLTGRPLVGEQELRERVPLVELASDERFVVLARR